MTETSEERKPEYSSDIVGDVDVLARGRAPFDPLAAPGGADDAAGREAAVAGDEEAVEAAGSGGRLDVRVTVRVPEVEAVRWREAATAAGVSVSDWLRARAAAGQDTGPVATGRPTPRKRALGRARVVRADPVVVEQLARIGNNLNQLARWANTEHRPVDVAALYGVGRQLAGLRDAVVAAASQEPATSEVVVDLVDDDDQDRHLAAGEDLEDDVAGVSVS
ncbi:MAG: MobC family plasmid mobilization relaxosome protein [Candidatus Microthrix sp.]|nr:MobC family plasmid mobilization relaxosome protein [Candidatus Microthrix sp.]